jgi:hypothetical protein
MSDVPHAKWLLRPWLGVALVVACSTFAPPTNVLITRTPPGDRAVQEEGTNLPLNHWDIGFAREGLKRGFFVVKSDLEWRGLWPSTDPDKVPLLPYNLDFAREMLIVSSPSDPEATASEVRAAILTDRSVHVYVTQTVLGADCPSTQDSAAKNFALVRVQRIDDKDVSFHVDTAFGDPCGAAPEAGITCKRDHSDDPLTADLKVEPGTKVACIASGLKASRPIFDLTWIWDALPLGSTAKIDVAKGSHGVTFVPDVIGTYRLALEVSDDLARKGKVAGGITVVPPPGPLSLQLAWTKVEAQDDPATFPRIELRVFGLTAEAVASVNARAASMAGIVDGGGSLRFIPDAAAPPGTIVRPSVSWTLVKACTASVPLSWCTAKVAGATTVAALDPSWASEFAVAVYYIDERVPGQPIACVRSYRDGKMGAERCDTEKRNAESFWEVGVIDAVTGKTPEMLAGERVAGLRAATPDAGPPPEAGRASDAAAAAAGKAGIAAPPPAASPSASASAPRR